MAAKETSLIFRENRHASYQDILPINEHLKEYDVAEFHVSPCLTELNSSHVEEFAFSLILQIGVI